MISTATALRTAGQRLSTQIDEPAPHHRVGVQHRVLDHIRDHRRSLLLLGVQGALTTVAYVFSVALLSEFYGRAWAWHILPYTLPALIGVRLLSFLLLGSCHLPLRSASVPELLCLTKTVSIGSLAFCALSKFVGLNEPLPAALFVLEWTQSIFLLATLHFALRVSQTVRAVGRTRGKRALVIGAGDAGTSVVRDLVLDPTSAVLPVGLVDDDREKHGIRIHGVPVLGGLKDLMRFVHEQRAEEVLICVPSATRSQMPSILARCRECGIPVRTLPSVAELIDGRASQRHFRSVPIEELLRREEATSDPAVVQEVVGNRVVLVTGGGGSIGSELCRHIAAANPSKLLIVDKSENSLFYINLELRERFPLVPIQPVLLDVTCRDRVREIFERECPEVVFHAAAHKHVHLLELHPHEAIRNNVVGTCNVALAARNVGAARFVNISTDKAVEPSNYMGLSKKMTELLMRELAPTSSTRFMSVRFGNVAGSTGSVLRLFQDQIQKGGPLKVSDPRATRYFMTIPEAVCLILHAAAQGEGGETFVFDMGEPLNIYEMACTFSLFSGLTPGKDLPIEFVGLKPGEKITEELWEQSETPRQTAHRRIFALSSPEEPSVNILKQVEEFERMLARDNREALLARVHTLFPSFALRHRAHDGPPKNAPRRVLVHKQGSIEPPPVFDKGASVERPTIVPGYH
jgi:FlaA1/EpsC-like NDP-sugar epimerase